MYSLWKTSTCLLMSLVFAEALLPDIPISSNYILENSDACPEVGYYLREAIPPPGPVTNYPGLVTPTAPTCFLCLCSNSTAACWERENSRCYGKKTVMTSGDTRVRRSPVGLSDIFFRDATREFFDKQLTQQCKPFEASYSDGCPPADWCVGCTVCDCDANGRWDCHILSFCNKEERKKMMKNKKVPLSKNIPNRKMYRQNRAIKVTPKPRKVIKKSVPKTQIKKPRPNARKQNNIKRKPNNNIKKPNNRGKPVNKRNSNNAKNSNIKKPQRKAKPQVKPKPQPKRTTTRKPRRKIYMVQKPQKRTIGKDQTTTTKIKTVRKQAETPNEDLQIEAALANLTEPEKLDESALGKKIVKRLMYSVQRMLGKQMEKLQDAKRVQRSIARKDCEKKLNKKKEKSLREYNLRKRKLRKYKQIYNYRKKRDALDLDLRVINFNDAHLKKDNNTTEYLSVEKITKNVTEFDFRGTNRTNTYLDISTQSNMTANSTTETTTKSTTFLNFITDNQYYTYSIDKNSNTSTTTELVQNNVESYINNTDLSHIETNQIGNMTEVIQTKTKDTEKAKEYTLIVPNLASNHLKYKNSEEIQILPDYIVKNNEVPMFHTLDKPLNDSSVEDLFLKRIKPKNPRKNIKKLSLLNEHNLKKIISDNFKSAPATPFGTVLTSSNSTYNISSLQILLQNLMKELNKNTMPQTKLRTKFSLFKYLKNIFQNIFSRKKAMKSKSHKTNEGMTLEILCENIGACYLNKNNRIALRYKIHDLNAETEKIFKTIKIIKGLLRLMEMPVVKENTTKKPLKDEIQKLDAVLRGTYGENGNLTETQQAQITYVKENIHQFIESVGKFATILNEILDVLYKNNKKYSCQRNLRLVHRKRKMNAFNKIKNLLVKYNIVQNTFMKKMYRLLTDAEKNDTRETSKFKVSDRDLVNTQVIDRNSKNIIENLRKLKNLAQTLSSKRRKRQTIRDDDAIEYLLVLMEYLLKQNHPLNTAPANDGIDLLIEAIQNAPEIEPIKKKLLDAYLPTTQTPTRTTSVDLSEFNEDSGSDSNNRIFKEEDKSPLNEKSLAIEQVADVEEDITQLVYYKKFDDDDNTTIHNEYDITTEFLPKNISQKWKTAEKDATGEKTGFDKFESAIDDTRRYEIFNSDVEDDPGIPVVINTTEKSVTTTVLTIVEETTFLPLVNYKFDDDIPSDKQTKLDWIEENFGKEIREYREDKIPKTTTLTNTEATTTPKPNQVVDNISSITAELDEEEKKKKAKLEAEEVMYRKQMEFLNSLDYGTEKSEFDDSGIKDDEKFSGDFPSYFVR